jgi:hypothetical protein
VQADTAAKRRIEHSSDLNIDKDELCVTLTNFFVAPANPAFLQAEEEAKKRAEEAAALRAALEAGEKLDPAAAESALRSLLADAGWDWAAGSGGPGAISKVAAGGLLKKLTVEGGVANKARALYAALFTAAESPAAAAADAEDGGDSPRANGDASNGNGSGSYSGGAKLGPSIGVAKELLSQLAHDAPGQLAQLVALEWLLAVSGESVICVL